VVDGATVEILASYNLAMSALNDQQCHDHPDA